MLSRIKNATSKDIKLSEKNKGEKKKEKKKKNRVCDHLLHYIWVGKGAQI